VNFLLDCSKQNGFLHGRTPVGVKKKLGKGSLARGIMLTVKVTSKPIAVCSHSLVERQDRQPVTLNSYR